VAIRKSEEKKTKMRKKKKGNGKKSVEEPKEIEKKMFV